jgi:iron complex outermembrane receptor protein
MAKRIKKYGVVMALLVMIFGPGVGTSLAESEAESVALDEVVVTAAQIDGYLEAHPQQVEVMNRLEIRESGYTDLNQVLNAMPGVDVKPSGSGLGSRLSIRGSGGGSKILVLINGRPMGSSRYGVVNLDSIPLDMVARVDVFKPPVPVWLGAGATAGAINIVLVDGTTEAGTDEKANRTGVTAGSFGKAGITASRLMKLGEHQLRVSVAGNHKGGRRENSDSDTGSLAFQWDLPADGDLTWDVGGRYYQSEHGSPGPLYNLTPDARQSYRHGDMDFRVQGPVGDDAGGFDLKAYMNMTRLEDESQTGLVSILDAVTYGVKDETSWSPEGGLWAFRFSGDLSGDRIDHTLTGEHHRENASLGVQGDRNFSAVIATLGGRMDYSTDYGFQPAADGGISISGGKNRLKVNAGYSVNIPSFSKLYQPSHGSIDQVRGNPDLEEESVWTVSAGFSHDFSDKRSVDVTFFHEGTIDKIAYQEGEDDIKRPVNIDEVWRRGVETTVSWKLTDAVAMDVNWICQESCNRDTGGSLTYAPDQKFKMALDWTLPTGTRTKTALNCVGSQYSDLENSQEKKVDGYTTVDMKIVHPVTLEKCRMEFSLQMENLLDKAYDVHYGYPDDGFRVTAGVTFDF